jgi:hypothetical protein
VKSGGTEGEYRRAQRRGEARAHLTDEHQRPPFVIVHENRIEVSADRSVPADHKIAPLESAHFLPRCRPLARFVRAIAPLGDDALETLLSDRVD